MAKKIILFYKYVALEDPEKMRQDLLSLCSSLDIKGRIILAREGINGTLCGTFDAVDAYIEACNNMPCFVGIDYKETITQGDDDYFPRLRIVVKNEIVRMGVSPDEVTVKDTGTHLTPEQFHEELKNNRDSIVLLDGRNNYEAAIGRFEGAIVPDIKYFRDYPAYIDENRELFEGKKVLMYCTGGIRCERASAYLKVKDIAQDVYQLEGGIHRYIEQFPDGFFRGKNYVFDDRITVRVNSDVLGNCALCAVACDVYANCMNASCNKHFICCSDCLVQLANTCSEKCQALVRDNLVPIRPLRRQVPENNQETR